MSVIRRNFEVLVSSFRGKCNSALSSKIEHSAYQSCLLHVLNVMVSCAEIVCT